MAHHPPTGPLQHTQDKQQSLTPSYVLTLCSFPCLTTFIFLSKAEKIRLSSSSSICCFWRYNLLSISNDTFGWLWTSITGAPMSLRVVPLKMVFNSLNLWLWIWIWLSVCVWVRVGAVWFVWTIICPIIVLGLLFLYNIFHFYFSFNHSSQYWHTIFKFHNTNMQLR